VPLGNDNSLGGRSPFVAAFLILRSIVTGLRERLD